MFRPFGLWVRGELCVGNISPHESRASSYGLTFRSRPVQRSLLRSSAYIRAVTSPALKDSDGNWNVINARDPPLVPNSWNALGNLEDASGEGRLETRVPVSLFQRLLPYSRQNSPYSSFVA